MSDELKLKHPRCASKAGEGGETGITGVIPRGGGLTQTMPRSLTLTSPFVFPLMLKQAWQRSKTKGLWAALFELRTVSAVAHLDKQATFDE